MSGWGVEVIQVIHTNLEKRGTGLSPDDIVRRVDQYWSMDGELLWEHDPCRGGRTGKQRAEQEEQS